MDIVVDTNVLISSNFFGGKPKDVVKLCFTDAVTAHVTDEIIAEYERVVREMQDRAKRKIPRGALDAFLLVTEKEADVPDLHVCRDPDDDKFIECAISVGAPYIVSGDKDLLDLERHGTVQMVTAAEFLKIMEERMV